MAIESGDPSWRILVNDTGGTTGEFRVLNATSGAQHLVMPSAGSQAGELILYENLRVGDRISSVPAQLTLEAPSSVVLDGGGLPFLIVDYFAPDAEMRLTADPSVSRQFLGLRGREVVLAAPLGNQGSSIRITFDANPVLDIAVHAASGGSPPAVALEASGPLLLVVPSDGASQVQIDGDALFAGATNVGGGLSADGDLVLGAGDLVIVDVQPVLELTSGGGRHQLRSRALAPNLDLFTDGSRASNDLLVTLYRSSFSGGTEVSSTIQGLFGLGRFPESEILLLSSDGDLAGRADELIDAVASASNAWMRAWNDGSPEALIAAGLPGFPPTDTRVSVGMTSGGVCRVGTMAAGGASAPTYLADRFRLDSEGQLSVYDLASAGSPGNRSSMTLQHGTASAPDVVLTVGTRNIQGRGRVSLIHGTPGNPTLLAHEADDGTKLYWSAWRDGTEIVLTASVTLPTSRLDGVELGRFT